MYILLITYVRQVSGGICDYVSVGLSVRLRPRSKKRLELSTPKSVDMAGPRHALTPRSKVKGQGHRVVKGTAGVGMHVEITARVSSW